MPLPPNGTMQGGRPGMQQMPQRPGAPQGMPQRPGMPQGQPGQQQMNPDHLKAKEMLLKAELLKVQAQKLLMGGGPQQPQGGGQPPRR